MENFSKTIISKYKDIFSFIIQIYRNIENKKYRNVFNDTFFHKLNSVKFSKDDLLFEDFIEQFVLKIAKNESELSDYFVARAILKFVDFNLEFFHDYNLLFEKTNVDLTYKDTGLIIRNYNLFEFVKSAKLRNKNFVHPNKLCYKLNLRNISFYKVQNNYKINHTFIKSSSLQEHSVDGFKIGFIPMCCVENFDKFVLKPYNIAKLDYDDNKEMNYFYIRYSGTHKCEYGNWYKNSLTKMIKEEVDFVIIPEIMSPQYALKKINEICFSDKKDTIIVAGTNWHKECEKYTSTVNVHRNNKLLLKQNKNFEFAEKLENANPENKCFEGITKEEVFEINVLHIESVGSFAFIVCSDLLNLDYISTILEMTEISHLVMVSCSYSNDIFSSLDFLSKQYLLNIYVCNACFKEKKDRNSIFLYQPKVEGTTRSFELKQANLLDCKECYLNKNDCCPGKILTESKNTLDIFEK